MFGFGKKSKGDKRDSHSPETATETQQDSSVTSAAAELSTDASTEASTDTGSENSTAEQERSSGGLFGRLKSGLSRTRERLSTGIGSLVLGEKTVDPALLDDVETQLLAADVGLEATDRIIGKLKQGLARKQLADPEAFMQALRSEMQTILEPCDKPLQISASQKPFVILMVGVNGVGKTTTIGKLAKRFQGEGKEVMLAAGDTFRAAAVEQLQVWGERNNVPVVAQATGADSASVIFDAYQSAKARNVDVLIADTAGRLHTKDNLMNELEKIVRVLRKQDERLPDEILLVLDATTGQNALSQADKFHESITLNGLVLTKLDGTAKGGVVFALAERLGIPIRFIGVGEQVDDLRPFAANQFVEALFTE
jgi:fused signal recognition particle receptor